LGHLVWVEGLALIVKGHHEMVLYHLPGYLNNAFILTAIGVFDDVGTGFITD
jgi:hypothetical protein